MPARVSLSTGRLIIDSHFSIQIAGHSDRLLEAATVRMTARVSRQIGIPFAPNGHPTLLVECRASSPEYPALNEDESYQLEITPAGARLSAPTTTGALRGLETFSQLVAPGERSFFVPALRIDDHPRFPWRGLMLDAARHWMPIPVIERNLDAMAAVKLNVFHWHLSDDQGFRVESQRFPKLQQLGSDGKFYTQADVRHIVDYARDRGIRVIPEFDMPGHATSWLVGYPELASAPGPFAIERKWGIFEPTLDPTREETYSFLNGLIGEMAALFPDEYFHIGGDEVLDAEWRGNPAIQAFAKNHELKDGAELHAYFNRRIQAVLKQHGKKLIGWDEVLAPGLANDAVIQSWRGQKSLAEAARKGYRGILSFGYYLDHMKPAAFHYRIDPLGSDDAQAGLILGGEACMWTEYATEETVDSRIWPRAAAIAERLWSPANLTDIDSMYRRLDATSRWLDWTGVEHRSGYQRMLQRLAGAHSTSALQVLADAVEALGINERQEARHYTSDVPLNRLVDAARPESECVLSLTRSSDTAGLRFAFSEWAANDGRLRPLLTGSFLLREAGPLSEDLSRAGTIGLRALQYLESGEQAPHEWLAAQKQELDRMEKPQAEVVLAAVRPVRALLDTISRATDVGDHRLKPVPPN